MNSSENYIVSQQLISFKALCSLSDIIFTTNKKARMKNSSSVINKNTVFFYSLPSLDFLFVNVISNMMSARRNDLDTQKLTFKCTSSRISLSHNERYSDNIGTNNMGCKSLLFLNYKETLKCVIIKKECEIYVTIILQKFSNISTTCLQHTIANYY